MKLLDDEGRIFGRVNIIDAMVLVVVALLIPLAYGAYLLFRTPQPRVLSVEPSRVLPEAGELTVRGENLRPYLRFTLGTQTTTFLFATPDSGVVQFPSLGPGTYDVVLYDASQELGRLRGGLVVDPPIAEPQLGPRVDLMVVGRFPGLDAEAAQALSETLQALGQEPGIGYVSPAMLAVPDGTYQIGAVLALRCPLQPSECQVGKVSIAPDAHIPILLRREAADFLIEEVHPAYTDRLDVTVLVTPAPEVLEAIHATLGDNRARFPARDALRPAIVSADAVTTGNAARVRFRVPAIRTPTGWLHGGRGLRLGNLFMFETPQYEVQGQVIAINPAPVPPRAP